jgi:hypothetical protein
MLAASVHDAMSETCRLPGKCCACVQCRVAPELCKFIWSVGQIHFKLLNVFCRAGITKELFGWQIASAQAAAAPQPVPAMHRVLSSWFRVMEAAAEQPQQPAAKQRLA